jgi:hypothetical protein
MTHQQTCDELRANADGVVRDIFGRVVRMGDTIRRMGTLGRSADVPLRHAEAAGSVR